MATPYYTRVPWTRKPPPGTRLDRSNLFAQKADAIFAFNEGGDITTDLTGRNDSQFQSDSGNPPEMRGALGRVFHTDNTGTDWQAKEIDLVSGTTGPAPGGFANATDGGAMFWHGQVDSVGGTEYVALINFGAANHGLGIRATGNYPYIRVAGDDRGNATVGMTFGVPETVLCYHEYDQELLYWVNGQPATGSYTLDGRNINHRVGSIGGYYGQGSMIGYTSLVIIFKPNYKPTDAEAKSLHENPWQIFEPQTIPIYVPAAAPAAARRFLTLLGVS